jgi:hypothetical protein
MADTISVPGFGSQKKQTVYIVAGGLVLILGVAYYRSRKTTAAAVTSTAGANTGIDPATGYAYGSPEEASALSAQSSYIDPAQYSYSGGGGYVDTSGGGNAGIGSTSVPVAITSNAQWHQQAVDYLANTVGLDGGAVSAALAKYLVGATLTDSDVSYVQQAIASEGLPPAGGANGYPPSMRTAPAPVTTPAPGKVAGSSYYYDLSNGGVYTVSNGKRYHLTPATWAKIKKQFPKGTPWYTEITSADPIMKLPNGGNI